MTFLGHFFSLSQDSEGKNETKTLATRGFTQLSVGDSECFWSSIAQFVLFKLKKLVLLKGSARNSLAYANEFVPFSYDRTFLPSQHSTFGQVSEKPKHLLSSFFFWRFFTAKIRILPLVIFCATLMFTVKITQLFHKVSSTSLDSFIYIQTSSAIAADEPVSPSGSAASAQKPEATSHGSGAREKLSAQSPSLTLKEATESGLPPAFSNFDPLRMSAEEFRMLQDLSAREKELERREEDLPEQQATTKAVEDQIDKKIQELQQAHKKLEELLNKIEEQEHVNIVRLVKVAENMKSKEAAKILEGIEFSVLLEIMEKVKEAKASAILSNMDPQKASYLMTELAMRKRVLRKDKSM